MHYPDSSIDFLLRKGNESLLDNHPHIRRIIIFDKKNNKYSNLLQLIRALRKEKYDYVINVQRFFTTGLITILSGGKHTIGFDKNPLSFLFGTTVKHIIPVDTNVRSPLRIHGAEKENITPPLGGRGVTEGHKGKVIEDSTPPLGGRGVTRGHKEEFTEDSTPPLGGRGVNHEVHRNLSLIDHITPPGFIKPKLYPSQKDYYKMAKLHAYICIAPASIWFTKQFPIHKWNELINLLPDHYTIYLLGAKSDILLCEEIKGNFIERKIEVLAGQLTFLESAALMQKATMNYVNDSAPLHFASAMNAPVTAIYCSTVPEFGFGPLSDIAFIGEIDYTLYCRPCGLHGYKACPESHFKCSEINVDKLISTLNEPARDV